MPDGVEIDVDQVGEFGRGMRQEAVTGFAQAARRGADLHQYGVVFGAAIGGDVLSQAKARYARALESTEANLRAYRQAAEIFAGVAETIAKDFALTDRTSAEAQRRVTALLDGALAQVGEVVPDSRMSGTEAL